MFRSLCIAVAMYSKLPTPRVDWDKKSLSWAMCFFPVVGVVIALLLGGWLKLCAWLDFGPFLRSAVALLLPIAVSGAIHLDGFCDTSDALGSHQSREKKLEILKDSHTSSTTRALTASMGWMKVARRPLPRALGQLTAASPERLRDRTGPRASTRRVRPTGSTSHQIEKNRMR